MNRYAEPKRPRVADRLPFANGLAALVLGLTAAVFCASLTLLWATSPVRSIPIVTPIVQGLLLGLILARILPRLNVRSPAPAFALGLICGLASLGSLHAGHYFKFVLSDIPRLIRQEHLPPGQTESLLRLQRADPFLFADQLVFRRKTGYAGFPGFMALRNHLGEQIAGRLVRHWPLWGLWTVEGALIALIPAVVAARPRPGSGADTWEMKNDK
jgi:hypothetical protein